MTPAFGRIPRARSLRLAALLSVLGVLPLGAQNLPAADDLISRYVEAIGGREAHLAPSSVRLTGTVSMAALGLQGDFELLQSLPDRMLLRISLPGIGEQVVGFDGQVGWSVNPMVGAMVLQGDELAQTRDRSHVLASLRDRQFVPERETVGRAEFGGQACWRVRLVWASGRESFDCYSTGTGLLVASEERQVTPMGEIPVTIVLSDYQEQAGMLIPRRQVQQAMGQEQVVTVTGVELNSVQPSELEPPESVRPLLPGDD